MPKQFTFIVFIINCTPPQSITRERCVCERDSKVRECTSSGQSMTEMPGCPMPALLNSLHSQCEYIVDGDEAPLPMHCAYVPKDAAPTAAINLLHESFDGLRVRHVHPAPSRTHTAGEQQGRECC